MVSMRRGAGPNRPGMHTYLARCPAFAQLLGHQAVLQIAEASPLLEVVLRQEHVEQTLSLRLSL